MPTTPQTTTSAASRTGATAAAARLEALWAMTPAERVAAYGRGELSLGACLAWARRHPHEIPIAAGGEWHFIAARTPEYLDEN